MFYCKYCAQAEHVATSVCDNCFYPAESIQIKSGTCLQWCNSDKTFDEKAVLSCGHWFCIECFAKGIDLTKGCSNCTNNERVYHVDMDKFDICQSNTINIRSDVKSEMAKLYPLIKSFDISNGAHYKMFHRHRQILILLEEYIKWLTIASDELSPSDAVDDVWKQHLLDTVSYRTTCLILRGHMIDRIPMSDKLDRFAATLKVYEDTFGPIPYELEHYWRIPDFYTHIYIYKPDSIMVFVRDLNGKTTTMYPQKTATMYIFKQLIRERIGHPVHQIRLIHGGKQLKDHKTFDDYGIGKEAVIEMVLRLSGC